MGSNRLISAADARENFGKYLHRIESGAGSLVIQSEGFPVPVLVSINECLRLAAPEPEILRRLGKESTHKGTNKLTSKQIDEIIRTARSWQPKRRYSRRPCA